MHRDKNEFNTIKLFGKNNASELKLYQLFL